jgi:hypothetical protein
VRRDTLPVGAHIDVFFIPEGHRMTLPTFARAFRARLAFVAAALLVAAGLPARAADPGARAALELRADDNLLALVETRVVNRSDVPTLEVRTRDGSPYSSPNPITLTVDVVTLSSLSIRGSGNVSGDGLKAPALKIAVSGSGNIKLQKLSPDEASLKISGSGNAHLSGKAARLSLSILGSGDIDTRDLEADEVSVRIAGSGDASVNAGKTLNVSISDSGSVKKR